MSRTVAIVGRPNVGKSRLFNRLARKRISIVHDQPGVTRDVISTEISEGAFTLLDTGGLGLVGGESTVDLIKASEKQVDFAIASADLILFVIDGLEGVTGLDDRIAKMLRKSKKNVLLVVNKADFNDEKVQLDGAYALGLGEPSRVSAEHGTGENDLRAVILERLGAAPEVDPSHVKTSADPLCFCFIGRPNVGKSSLSNNLLQSDRLVVSPIPGTTRDSVELPFKFKGRDGEMYPFKLIDTAGIKAATKLASPVEYFSRLRSLDAIQRADVVFLVLDALEGVTQQDKAIAGEAIKEKKPIVIVVNKWDLVEKQSQTLEEYKAAIKKRLQPFNDVPIVFTSALTKQRVLKAIEEAMEVYRRRSTRISKTDLNDRLLSMVKYQPPPIYKGKEIKIKFITQLPTKYPQFVFFCNLPQYVKDSYSRFVENQMRQMYDLTGVPIDLFWRKSS
jgi:GTP-binding protein